MRIVYIAHPIGGNVEVNLNLLKLVVKEINEWEPNVVPFVPYYADCVAMDDSDPDQRERGIRNNHEMFRRKGLIDELRLYGDKVSKGMWGEVLKAFDHGIPVVPMSEGTKRDFYAYMFNMLNSTLEAQKPKE